MCQYNQKTASFYSAVFLYPEWKNLWFTGHSSACRKVKNLLTNEPLNKRRGSFVNLSVMAFIETEIKLNFCIRFINYWNPAFIFYCNSTLG